MPFALLLAMQAAGMIIDWYGSKQQVALGRMGAKVEQAGIESNIAQSRLETEDQTVEAMKQLRQNLGSQAALFAARGQRGNAGSALSISNESISNFDSDKRMRDINQKGREAALKAGMTMSKLHQSASESDIWSSFLSRSAKNFPASSIGEFGNSGNSGSAIKSAAAPWGGRSFGISSV